MKWTVDTTDRLLTHCYDVVASCTRVILMCYNVKSKKKIINPLAVLKFVIFVQFLKFVCNSPFPSAGTAVSVSCENGSAETTV